MVLLGLPVSFIYWLTASPNDFTITMESEVLAIRFKDNDSVELTPFRHQVGGHFVIMDFDEHRLAKPVVPRELFFYQTAPKDVCTFIPRYHGEVLSPSEYGAVPTRVHVILATRPSPPLSRHCALSLLPKAASSIPLFPRCTCCLTAVCPCCRYALLHLRRAWALLSRVYTRWVWCSQAGCSTAVQ